MRSVYVLLAIVLLSCSKKENTDTQTAPAGTDANQSAPASSAQPERKPVELTEAEIQTVAWYIFKKFHSENMSAEPDVIAHVEDFTVEGNKISYKLLRRSVKNFGWVRHEDEEGPAPLLGYDENPVASSEGDASEGGDENDDEEEDSPVSTYIPRYGEVQQVWTYSDEIDTLYYESTYASFLESGEPESATKMVRIVFDDYIYHKNYYDKEEVSDAYNNDRTARSGKMEIETTDLIVELGTPIIIDGDQIYLRAKVADLTDSDLAGMTKDQLGYARNEIFARHGHTFKTPKMIEYFGRLEWYHILVGDAAPLLNAFEKRNVEFIKKKEG